MMVPSEEYARLIQHYKGKLTESGSLNKAACLAADKHLLLKDPKMAPSEKVARVKPLSKQLQKWTRRVRHAPLSSGVKVASEEEDEGTDDALNTPLENLLKKVLKQTPSTKTVKREPVTPKVEDVEEDDEEDPFAWSLPKRKKKKRKSKKTEVDKLKPQLGWEDWAKGKQLRRNLEDDYDESPWSSSKKKRKSKKKNLRWFLGHTKVVGKDWNRVPLTWVRVRWPRHAPQKETGVRRQGHQSFRQDRASTRYRLL